MGFALPAAIATKLVHPDRNVVAVSGDGGFMMNAQELETAVRLGTAVVNVVWQDDGFGSIAWKQEMRFGRHFGTDFGNPDLVRFAESFGIPAWRCDTATDFAKRLEEALAAGRPEPHRRADRLLARRRDRRGARRGADRDLIDS
jgi:acetolactate synthase-1/2/3 large subunit